MTLTPKVNVMGMLGDMKYEDVYSEEGIGLRSYGIKIQLCVDPSGLTHISERAIRKAAEEIKQAVLSEQERQHPDTIEQVTEDRKQLLALFPQPIYVEEIPNGYGNDWYYRNRPWYRVTTRIGRIEIGWRKRVISINWADTVVDAKATEMFPNEDVTKHDRLIHAWSYEKAKEYILKLHSDD